MIYNPKSFKFSDLLKAMEEYRKNYKAPDYYDTMSEPMKQEFDKIMKETFKENPVVFTGKAND